MQYFQYQVIKSLKYDYVKPNFVDEVSLDITDGIHPLLDNPKWQILFPLKIRVLLLQVQICLENQLFKNVRYKYNFISNLLLCIS